MRVQVLDWDLKFFGDPVGCPVKLHGHESAHAIREIVEVRVL